MRTSTIISYSALFASSGAVALALSFAAPESFDNSLLRARAALPDVVAMDSSLLVKRAEGPWDCSEDEEYVPYEDEEGDDDDNDDDTPVFEPAKQQGQVKAVQQSSSSSSSSTPAPSPEAQKQEQQQQHAPSSKKNEDNSKPTPAPKSSNTVSTTSSVSTPDNIAEGTYTADEGCARYYQVKSGDVCLKLVEDNKDLGLTLDQLYCLNPAIDDLCYNLWIGTSYCVGYSGEEPLNTGVSSA